MCDDAAAHAGRVSGRVISFFCRTKRRWRLALGAIVAVALRVVNTTFWVLPTAYIVGNSCAYFTAVAVLPWVVRWTCW